MRTLRGWMAVLCWLGFGSLALSGTTTREPGLWETTSTTTWQKSPEIPGEQAPKLHAGTHTTQACLTEEMIKDYGALLPRPRGQCTIENQVFKDGKVTGDYVCSGMMSGRGKLESSWTDAEHATGRVHFSGTFQVGAERQPVEWTTETTSTFKSPNCGSVKPEKLLKR